METLIASAFNLYYYHGAFPYIGLFFFYTDTPIRTWNFFHGARISDVHDSAVAIKKALGSQILVGVGYSMGAIILNSYVAAAGKSCALDAAFSISGALDCRYELSDTRSKILWQPLLADSLKSKFLLGKHGKKVRKRLRDFEMVQLIRASSVVVSTVDRPVCYVVIVWHEKAPNYFHLPSPNLRK